MLAAFVHPNHIAYLCSWGFTHLPPTCSFKLFGYSCFIQIVMLVKTGYRYFLRQTVFPDSLDSARLRLQSLALNRLRLLRQLGL
ncbi:hypothetical protein Y702_15605 [Vibrio vulnificus BAA87]|nr:hypothetical protein Y702_15605 [Vibrio vulnificus BAA87]